MKATYTITQEDVGISARHPISVWRMSEKHKTVHPHDHAYHEIAFCVGGSGWHLTGDRREKISRGDLLVSAPGQVHSVEIPEWLDLFDLFYLAEWVFHDLQDYWEHPQLCMLFGASLLYRGQEAEPAKHLKLGGAFADAAQRECEDLAAALKKPVVSHLYLRATFEKIVALVGAHMEVDDAGTRPEVWQSLRRIETIIQSGEPFCPEALARDTSVHAAHLARVFVRETGKSPMEFYQQRRAQVACVRLLNPLRSITDIAMELGYSDTAHFSRVFRRYYHTSPRDFRTDHGIKPRRKTGD